MTARDYSITTEVDETRVAAEVAEPVARDVELRPGDATKNEAVPRWELAVQAPFGAMKPANMPRRELVAVAEALAALEADLEEPITAADRMVLGSIGRALILEHRAFRLTARGIVTSDGNVRGVVSEYRQLARLKADLLSKLTLKRRRKDVPTLEAILAAHAARSGASGGVDAPEASAASDRATAANGDATS